MGRALCVVLMAGLLGCASSGERTARPTSASGTPPAAVLPSPVPPVPLATLQQARLRLDGGPDPIGIGTDSVWVKGDDGRVHRIDPRTNRTVASVAVASRLCQGLGVAADEVWVCTDDGIGRIDPHTNMLSTRAPVGRVADQAAMPIGRGHVWVLPGDGRTLVGVATASGAADTHVALGAACFGAALLADDLWLACRSDNLVLHVDSTGRVRQRVTGLPSPTGITAGDAVYVSYQGGVARIDAVTGRVTAAVRVATDQGMLLAASGQLWVRSPTAFLRQLDPTSLAVLRDVRSAETAGGSVAVGFGSVWASVFDNTNGSVYRLRD